MHTSGFDTEGLGDSDGGAMFARAMPETGIVMSIMARCGKKGVLGLRHVFTSSGVTAQMCSSWNVMGYGRSVSLDGELLGFHRDCGFPSVARGMT